MPETPIIIPAKALFNNLIITSINPYNVPPGKIDGTSTRQGVASYKSFLGTPVVSSLTIEGGSYTDDNGKQHTFPSITIDCVLISLHQVKQIIRTQIQGAEGSVKEYDGMDDWDINISFIVPGANNGDFKVGGNKMTEAPYPTDAMEQLHLMWKAPVSLKVTSWYLQIYDINAITINDIQLGQEGGNHTQQPVTLQCYSDNIIDAEIVSGT